MRKLLLRAIQVLLHGLIARTLAIDSRDLTQSSRGSRRGIPRE